MKDISIAPRNSLLLKLSPAFLRTANDPSERAFIFRLRRRVTALRAPAKMPVEKRKTAVVYNYDPQLMEMLKALRKKAAERQGIPVYMVFSDSALRDMCIKLPRTEKEFLSVSGVGAAKLERYGSSSLDAINAYVIQNFPKAVEVEVTTKSSSQRRLKNAASVKNGFEEIKRGLANVSVTEDIHITGFCDSIIAASGADISVSALRNAVTG